MNVLPQPRSTTRRGPRRLGAAVASGVLALALSACASASGDSGAGSPVELDFTAETVGGAAFDGAELTGTPTVLWFWSPWCPTCRAQISGVSELAETYGSDLQVVGVGAMDDPAAIEAFAAEVSSDVVLLSDPDGAVWRYFDVTTQSTYLVLDEDGNEQASGYLDDAELVETVDDILG